MWSDVAVLLGASDQKIILQRTHQRSSDHPIRMSVCKKKNLRGQAISSKRRVEFDIGGVVVSGAWEEGFCISWELEAANFLAPEKSCQSTFPGPKKWSICFSATLFFHHFPPFFLLRPLWAHHSSWRLNCLVSLPLFLCKSSLFLHYFVKTTCYLCYSVAPVSNSFPSTGGISSKIFSWRFKTVSNPLANWQFLNHQGLKVV